MLKTGGFGVGSCGPGDNAHSIEQLLTSGTLSLSLLDFLKPVINDISA